jgi:hypothetical protein
MFSQSKTYPNMLQTNEVEFLNYGVAYSLRLS